MGSETDNTHRGNGARSIPDRTLLLRCSALKIPRIGCEQGGAPQDNRVRQRACTDFVACVSLPRQVIDCVFMSLFTCCSKWRRRCPWWLCCCCNAICPGRTSAAGGRYSRVTTGEEGEEDQDSDLDDDDDDDDVDFGAREEEEDLYRLRRGRGGAGAPKSSG